ncbi:MULTISPECIES: TonB-dependent receptor [unclassified Pseudoalteromonas]|uniref:TonB-dependent receptor n=1 Tax=unclassified Pseudoalteromonas TaxID=194690 RepID=UPI0011091EBB|nr:MULTISPECIES: TonB-dependent receptor [unclassified Pseudoalteromonas]TMN84157.1 TonB-dependent receptor [Pseudoalteromonas sp. S410]TMN90601.1 TonB-dependent receptor [Pseudoalteromonas sp. S408]TMN95273.1 TonB-dependent receptor [Pseudoalteromonas sp. S407]TMN97829.1 TonB-dependent receptor [Pseudoalteromonas sp. S409]TMO06865.1 TonB-dependent receptor [Pseudoalteromonas sp. S186]
MFKPSLLTLAMSGALTSAFLLPNTALAQEQETAKDKSLEVIEVTATRRSGSVQNAPLNITALDADIMKDQNISELADVARWVPGLTITDQGGRSGSPIIVRGLNTNSSGPSSDGGTVATYINEIPVAIDMRLVDVERVEVLIGPQGTLYGAGTLGGAIRYMLKEPELDFTSLEVFGNVSQTQESDSIGGEGGFIFNLPLIEDKLAVRASLNVYEDPGFIDYGYVVREPGVSLPDPDWTDSAAINNNLKNVEDANGETTTTGRISVRFKPSETLEGTLNYFYQNQDSEGRSIVHYNTLSADNGLSNIIGKYESAYRYEESREKENQLLSLELKADLGFAELVSATGISNFDADGQRDQTDLLIRLDYGYEEFPAFSSFTRELEEQDTFTQEIRLVSQNDSDINWIVGGFYNKIESDASSQEYTPGFGDFAVENFGADQSRPDQLEYYSVDRVEITESALFGEIGYQVTDKLDITVGARFYKYDVESESAVDFPLFNTLFGGAGPDDVTLNFEQNEASDNGSLFKFNAKYQFTNSVMGYATISEGFRIGGSNGLAPCPDPLPANQAGCGNPSEMLYDADTTTNYELGFKSTWLRSRLHFNAALFNIDWDDAQVAGATEVGQLPYLSNAGSANAKGIEISSRAILSDSFSVYSTYAYTKAELTSDAPFLFNSDGTDGAEDGDRLPGSSEHQFSMGVNYQTDVFNDKTLDINYGITAQSDVISRVGLRDNGETLPGYSLSNISAKLTADEWSATVYVDNVFNKYAVTSVRRSDADITSANRTDIQRNYGYFINRPLTVGIKFNYKFEI